jgi:LPXTG-motif cell wall-anchored protein
MPSGTVGVGSGLSGAALPAEIDLFGGKMVQRLLLALLGTCLAFSLAATAQAQPAPTVKVVDDPKLGKFLTDDKGMTLYMYTRDTANTSNCYDQCATRWPALVQAAGQPVAPAGLTGALATAARKDGTQQVTYNGMPLYYFAQDTKPGDTNGQNVGTVWFVVAPGSTFASFPAAPPAQPAAAPAAAPAAPAAAPAVAAAPPAAPASQPAAQLPRTGDLGVDPAVAGVGLALVGLGFGLRRRRTARVGGADQV